MKNFFCENAACDYCFYAERNEKSEIVGCACPPRSALRDALAINHDYCSKFVCEYVKEHGECRRKP